VNNVPAKKIDRKDAASFSIPYTLFMQVSPSGDGYDICVWIAQGDGQVNISSPVPCPNDTTVHVPCDRSAVRRFQVYLAAPDQNIPMAYTNVSDWS
jgi:hypothetical protein